jgi:hypothetical protein
MSGVPLETCWAFNERRNNKLCYKVASWLFLLNHTTMHGFINSKLKNVFLLCLLWKCGPGSSVGIATDYGLEGPGIESRWGVRFSASVQTGSGAHPASCTMGTESFPKVKSGRGVTTPHPPSSAVGHERVELYLYSPNGPYSLCRASVPLQGSTLPFYLVKEL